MMMCVCDEMFESVCECVEIYCCYLFDVIELCVRDGDDGDKIKC